MGFKADLKQAFLANFDANTRQKIANAFCNQYNYTGDNTVTAKADFAADKIIQIIRQTVKAEDVRLQRLSLPEVQEITVD